MTGYRFKCPYGHTSIELINGHILCRRCERCDWNTSDGHYDVVEDTLRDEYVDREEIAQRETNQFRGAGD